MDFVLAFWMKSKPLKQSRLMHLELMKRRCY